MKESNVIKSIVGSMLVILWTVFVITAWQTSVQYTAQIKQSEDGFKAHGLVISFDTNNMPTNTQPATKIYAVINATLFAQAAIKLDPPPIVYEYGGTFKFFNVTCISATPMAKIIGQCDTEQITELDYSPFDTNWLFGCATLLAIFTAACAYVVTGYYNRNE